MDEPVNIACTLEAAQMGDRLAAWQGVLDHAATRTSLADGARRVEFDDGLAIDELARLVVDEQACCAFFSFAITVDTRGVALEVSAPNEATELVAALFG